jgi:hypothetical protein
MREMNFFHRSSTQTVREARVVNDLATADVDSVMQKSATRCDKVRAQRRFLDSGQEPVGTVYPGTVRDDDGEFVRLLHGSITRLWAMVTSVGRAPEIRASNNLSCKPGHFCRGLFGRLQFVLFFTGISSPERCWPNEARSREKSMDFSV